MCSVTLLISSKRASANLLNIVRPRTTQRAYDAKSLPPYIQVGNFAPSLSTFFLLLSYTVNFRFRNFKSEPNDGVVARTITALFVCVVDGRGSAFPCCCLSHTLSNVMRFFLNRSHAIGHTTLRGICHIVFPLSLEGKTAQEGAETRQRVSQGLAGC